MISNAVMWSIDEVLSTFADSRKSVYSRYADDLVFSTNKKSVCKEFYKFVKKILKRVRHPSLCLNDEKTFFSSRGTRRVITGIYVTPEGGTSVGRKSKRYIRKLLFDFKNDNLSSKNLSYLQGYLAFILDVEPDLFNRLSLKYGGELLKSALESRLLRV